jgi:hypothetical protein
MSDQERSRTGSGVPEKGAAEDLVRRTPDAQPSSFMQAHAGP